MTKYIFILFIFIASSSQAKTTNFVFSIHLGYTLDAGFNFGMDAGYYPTLRDLKFAPGLVLSRSYIYRATRVDKGFHTISQLKAALKYEAYTLKYGYGIIKNKWRERNICYSGGSNFEISYRLSDHLGSPSFVYQLQRKQSDWEWMDHHYNSFNIQETIYLKDLDEHINP